MEVKVEDVGTTKKRITLEIEPERVDRVIEASYKKLGQKANLKGFRPGKVPRPVLEKVYAGQMEEDSMRELINQNYIRAMLTQNFSPVGEPALKEKGKLEKGKPFTFTLEVEVKPQVEAKDYKGIHLQKERLVIDDQRIDERVDEIRKEKAELKDAAHDTARTGDHVVIDFEGFVGDKPIEHGKAEDYDLELGSHSLIPGFEEQSVGMRLNEKKDIEVTFPAEYSSQELAGKPARFSVFLKAIREKVLPELNDDFVKQYGVDTVAEFRARLAKAYEDYEKKRIEDNLREQIVSVLIEKNPIEVPETLVEEHLRALFDNFEARLKKSGLSLEKLGMTIEEYREKNRPRAVRQVQAALILEAITHQEQIAATPEDIEARMEEMAREADVPLEKVKAYYEESDERKKTLKTMVLEDKVVNFIVSGAQVEEVDKVEKKN